MSKTVGSHSYHSDLPHILVIRMCVFELYQVLS